MARVVHRYIPHPSRVSRKAEHPLMLPEALLYQPPTPKVWKPKDKRWWTCGTGKYLMIPTALFRDAYQAKLAWKRLTDEATKHEEGPATLVFCTALWHNEPFMGDYRVRMGIALFRGGAATKLGHAIAPPWFLRARKATTVTAYDHLLAE